MPIILYLLIISEEVKFVGKCNGLRPFVMLGTRFCECKISPSYFRFSLFHLILYACYISGFPSMESMIDLI